MYKSYPKKCGKTGFFSLMWKTSSFYAGTTGILSILNGLKLLF